MVQKFKSKIAAASVRGTKRFIAFVTRTQAKDGGDLRQLGNFY